MQQDSGSASELHVRGRRPARDIAGEGIEMGRRGSVTWREWSQRGRDPRCCHGQGV